MSPALSNLALSRAPRTLAATALLVLGACAPSVGPVSVPAPAAETAAELTPAHVDAAPPASTAPYGVLVMAHGGDPEWNAGVSETVEVLSAQAPTRLAFGMANRVTMEAALDSLRNDGVERVAVVRMFLSGESFREQTDYFLGLSDDRPAFFMHHGGHGGGHGGHSDHADPMPIEHGLAVATHDMGIMNSTEAAQIMAQRAAGVSKNAGNESVLILAHGMGDEAKNDAVLASMQASADAVAAHGFADVKAAALREDWAEARATAEAEILEWVGAEVEVGRGVIVVPFRLFGFGPYAQVLGDLPYTPTDGLLPHSLIAEWASRTAGQLACAQGWSSEGCQSVVAEDPNQD